MNRTRASSRRHASEPRGADLANDGGAGPQALVRQARAVGAVPVLAAYVTPDVAPALRERVVYRYVPLEHEELAEPMVGVLASAARAEGSRSCTSAPQ